MSLARAQGWVRAQYPSGPNGDISDVPGIAVGHTCVTDATNDFVQTGVTVVLPGPEDPFRSPLPAAVHTINGYGKPAGLEQIRELGQLETPIALTNTLSVGAVHQGLVQHCLRSNRQVVRGGRSINPIVFECNDARVNELDRLAVTPHHVLTAIDTATSGPVSQGTVGAGRGMSAFGWKAGVGSASAVLDAARGTAEDFVDGGGVVVQAA